MASDPTSIAAFARRITAALMVLVLATVSIASSVAASPAIAATRVSAAAWSGPYQSVPKPCQKAVLPGAINTCPLAAFSVNGLPSNDPGAAAPSPVVHALHWRTAHLRLPPQCGASSPYRPPRRLA
ncbi:hypothetical protein ACQR1W_37540 [Bradyrhizobium sp. HKCCYLS1011]|uniref:hypothetical protein n=1 Tax=Bradyrhizobium sp. HKCCYLS1011 TaxID=3420733 RepID=UPI003EC13B46